MLRVVRLWLRINGDSWAAIETATYDYCYFLMQAIDQNIDGREICKVVYIQGPYVSIHVRWLLFTELHVHVYSRYIVLLCHCQACF